MRKNKNPITEMLKSPDKGQNEPTGKRGILAALFRIILADSNMNLMRFSSLMNDYVRKVSPPGPDKDIKQFQTQVRNNLMKELGKVEMTWLVFCKALTFMQALKVTFSAKVYWKSGHVTDHKIDVNLSRDYEEDQKDDDAARADPNYEDDDEDEPIASVDKEPTNKE